MAIFTKSYLALINRLTDKLINFNAIRHRKYPIIEAVFHIFSQPAPRDYQISLRVVSGFDNDKPLPQVWHVPL
jgi:hypothetical protein